MSKSTQSRKETQMAHYKYLVIPLEPSNSGFGEWQRSLYTAPWARSIEEAVRNLTDGIEGHAIELPNAELSEAGRDITGLIHDEPSRVFAYQDDYGDYAYFGLEER